LRATSRARIAANIRLKAQFRYDASIAIAATKATAVRGDFGIRASRVINRAIGPLVATAYPPTMIIAICSVKVIRLQKPMPQASTMPNPLVAAGSSGRFSSGSPVTRPKTSTTKVPTRTNPNASGNHFSVKAVNRSATRASGPSPSTSTFACFPWLSVMGPPGLD